MRVVPLKEAIALDYGEKIPSFRARIKSVIEQSHGENDHGPWTIQNLTVQDPADPKAEIKLKLFDQEAVPQNWKGRVIFVESGQDEKKGGLCDVTLMQDTYKWKQGQPEKKLIEVRKRATVNLDQANAPAPEEKNPATQQQQKTATENTATEHASTKGANGGGVQQAPADQPKPKRTEAEIRAEREAEKKKAVENAARFAARKVSGFRVILRAMDALAKERADMQKPLTESQFQGITSSIFIAGDRSFVWDKLPIKTEEIEKYWPGKPAQAPDDSGE